ncbi:MAG TPA: efflux transporter periplasmic adaptor subunit [Gallionella sp.]|jgi:cobalt-zinc-cadmium efflux system membrane fusion protein|nr:efflux RND transporter periplasmic adaptor subunit [Gallionella sp.]OGS67489.1 MAG: efflux transporter periplasmic adaptor subunit [Gallionellales bacterium GWA2_54_124]HCI52319.1 efflux transporter periplasmic adaptor subunit [Gallionella sp.]
MNLSKRYVLPALVLVVLLGACQKKQETPETAPAEDPGLVSVTPLLLKRLTILAVGEGEMADTVRVPARIEVDEQRVARIGAAVTGRLTEIHAELGQRVRRGEVLAILHSAELSTSQLAYLKAVSQEGLQLRAVARAKLLFESDVISSAELQKRESELLQAEAERQTSHDQLRVLGMTEADIKQLASTRSVHSVSSVIATIDGVVIERKITQGQVVQPADALFTVADLSHVWLVAEIPEQQAGLVRAGGVTEAEIPALGDQAIKGRLIFVSDTVKPDTRTVTARMDVENADRLIKPGMLASMLIRGALHKRLMVPVVAVVHDGSQDYVFVQKDAQHFELRQVKLGQENAGVAPVISGLAEGEKIVTEGAFHLNNERRRKELEG